MKAHRTLAALTLFVIPISLCAEALIIHPALVDSSDQVESAMKRNDGQASTTLKGKGKSLLLTYSSDEAIEVFMVPLNAQGGYSPTDFLWFTLPATKDGNVNVDLTVSPGWSPGEKMYLLNMLSKTEQPNAYFVDAEFQHASFFDIARAGVRHLFTVEPFTPSTYHALRGFRVFGSSVTIVFGILAILIAVPCFVFSAREKKVRNAVLVFFAATSLYALRWSGDLIRFTYVHLTEFSAEDTYDESGSMHLVSEVLKLSLELHDSVFICRDGTNFKEKLLRYYSYPIQIVSETATGATFVIVMDKFNWSYTPGKDEFGALKCGPINTQAEKTTTFTDGSTLFKLKE